MDGKKKIINEKKRKKAMTVTRIRSMAVQFSS